MERMLTASDVAERLAVSKRSAYDIVHRLPHMEDPLRVERRVLESWIAERMVYPTSGTT